MRYVQAILLLVFLGALGIFAVQNTNTITVRFLEWGINAPLALVSVAVYLLGMLTGWTVVAFVSRSLRRVSERRKVDGGKGSRLPHCADVIVTVPTTQGYPLMISPEQPAEFFSDIPRGRPAPADSIADRASPPLFGPMARSRGGGCGGSTCGSPHPRLPSSVR